MIVPQVGAVLLHSEAETIPDNVTIVESLDFGTKGTWTRYGTEDRWGGIDPYGNARADRDGRGLLARAGRLTVVEVRDTPPRLVARLPELPSNAVALVGTTSGRRWEKRCSNWHTERGPGGGAETVSFAHVLACEGEVEIITREPRRWSKLEGAPGDLLKVKVDGVRWFRSDSASTRWINGTGLRVTFSQLRSSGEVVEDFDE